MPAQVDLEVRDRCVLGQRRWTAARERVQTSHELTKREWLREVVVCSGIETTDAIIDRVARRQHEHGRSDAAAAQRLTQVKTAASRQHDVEDDHVKGSQDCPRSSDFKRRLTSDLESVLAQAALDDRGELRSVFDQQNTHI